MQAVILAGGLGTRLRPLTDSVPKPMVKVRGTEFLWYLVSWLERNGVEDVVICAGHLSESIARKLSTYPRQQVNLRLSMESRPLGTAGAVRNARALLDEEFLLVNGDTYLPIPYEKVISRWPQVKGRFDCLLVVYTNRDKIAPNDTAVDNTGVVVAYSKQSPEGMQYVNAGLALMKKSVFDVLPADSPSSLEQEVFPELIRRRKMSALITDQRYYDIGTPERLKVFEQYVDRHPEVISGETIR